MLSPLSDALFFYSMDSFAFYLRVLSVARYTAVGFISRNFFMDHSCIRHASLVGLLVLLGAGCGNTPPAQPNGSGIVGTNTQTEPANPSRGQTACDHEYYPLHPGYEVAYQSSFGPTGAYTLKVTDGAGDSVKLNLDFAGGTHSEQQYRCENGNLKSLGFVDLASLAQNGRATVETKSVDGYVLPRDIRVGSNWTTKFAVSMSIPVQTADSEPMKVDAEITIRQSVIGEERVTVPAGTFTALKVSSETFVKTSIPGQPALSGGGDDTPMVTATEWWVKGKGLVKSVTPMVGAQPITVEATDIKT